MSQSRMLKGSEAMLAIVAGDQSGTVVRLDQSRLIIGFEADCGLVLRESDCNRHHAAILCDAFTVRIRDLGSQNGTFVNGDQVRSATVLCLGDEIRIGNTVMVVRRCEGGPSLIIPERMSQSGTNNAIDSVIRPKILF